MIAFVFAKRFQNVLLSIIIEIKTTYVMGRYKGANSRYVLQL